MVGNSITLDMTPFPVGVDTEYSPLDFIRIENVKMQLLVKLDPEYAANKQLQLIFDDCVLEDGLSLSHYNIKNESTLTLVLVPVSALSTRDVFVSLQKINAKTRSHELGTSSLRALQGPGASNTPFERPGLCALLPFL